MTPYTSGIVEIRAATLRDATWVAYHFNDDDWTEAACQLPDSVSKIDVGAALSTERYSYVAFLRGEPVFLFGFSPRSPVGMEVFGMGTDKSKRVIPVVTRWMREIRGPAFVADGYRWFEARSIATHTLAHGWLEALGATRCATLPEFGKDGEEFFLFRLLYSAYKPHI